MPPIQPRSFTLTFDGLVREIKSQVHIAPAFDPSKTKLLPPHKVFNAIWDTGATHTVITQKVIEECGLKPIGMTKAHSASGEYETTVYMINVVLINNVGFSRIKVSQGNFLGADVLIGMDLISRGDFALTNFNGKSVFSFRTPSIESINFVNKSKPTDIPLPPKPKSIGRNEPCPCGSGHKYKKCCMNKEQPQSTV